MADEEGPYDGALERYWWHGRIDQFKPALMRRALEGAESSDESDQIFQELMNSSRHHAMEAGSRSDPDSMVYPAFMMGSVLPVVVGRHLDDGSYLRCEPQARPARGSRSQCPSGVTAVARSEEDNGDSALVTNPDPVRRESDGDREGRSDFGPDELA